MAAWIQRLRTFVGETGEKLMHGTVLAVAAILRRSGRPPPQFMLTRWTLASMFLKGEGIEIGALHLKLDLPRGVKVRYVDRLPVDELRRQYPELANEKLVNVDILDNGETLATVSDASQDFVIANGFLEHCENPLGAVKNMMRVLKPGGILYLALPDKRHTFDRDRPVTPLAHLLADHRNPPARPRSEDFEEWTRLVYKIEDDAERKRRTEELLAMNYSIHYHVWTHAEMLELLVALERDLGLRFTVELFRPILYEVEIILRKSDA